MTNNKQQVFVTTDFQVRFNQDGIESFHGKGAPTFFNYGKGEGQVNQMTIDVPADLSNIKNKFVRDSVKTRVYDAILATWTHPTQNSVWAFESVSDQITRCSTGQVNQKKANLKKWTELSDHIHGNAWASSVFVFVVKYSKTGDRAVVALDLRKKLFLVCRTFVSDDSMKQAEYIPSFDYLAAHCGDPTQTPSPVLKQPKQTGKNYLVDRVIFF